VLVNTGVPTETAGSFKMSFLISTVLSYPNG
jgi:hypothetical protein